MKHLILKTTAVIFTLGAVGGALAIGKQHRGYHDGADFITKRITRELELDTTQQQALELLKNQAFATRESMHENFSQTPEELKQLLTADTFDQGKALELVTEKTAAINAAAPEMVTSLGVFLDTLSAEQKQTILERIEDHHDRH